jgi:hypothetical protein
MHAWPSDALLLPVLASSSTPAATTLPLFFTNAIGLRREGAWGRQARWWGQQEGGVRALVAAEAAGPGWGGGRARSHGRGKSEEEKKEVATGVLGFRPSTLDKVVDGKVMGEEEDERRI